MKILLLYALTTICFNCRSQELIEHYDSVYVSHISFPYSWATGYCLPTNIGLGDGEVRKCVFLSFSNEQLINHSKVTTFFSHITDPLLYAQRSSSFSKNIYKSFTTSHNAGQSLSVKYPIMNYHYDTTEELQLRYHKGSGVDTFVITTMIFIHNNDIIELCFSCRKDHFKELIPLFLDIANSVYFD